MLHRFSRVVGLAVMILFGGSDATIRIVDSGREYQSWPDQELGPTLALGEIYKARLQQIKGNSYFCSDSQNEDWKVTVPDDGLPVALYVKRGLCSYETKAKHASKYLPNIVKFLIIDGYHHLVTSNHDSSEEYHSSLELVEPSLGMESDHFSMVMEPSGANNSDYDLELTTSTSSFDFVSRALRRKKKLPTDHSTITVSVLHVSYATGYNLLDLLLQEFPSTRDAGGTMIELTGEIPSNSGQQKKIILLICCVFIGMSVTLSLLNNISTVLEATQPVQPTPYPRRRCRLTPWQVRKKFPLGVFDGSQLNFVPPKRQHPSQDCESPANHGVGNGKVFGGSKTLIVPEPLLLSDDSCTICLDEFKPGDKLRCLPCQHCFHSPCISKWLTERSATCPLCKIDLYESDDENDDEDFWDGETPLGSSWNSVPPETLTVPTEQDTRSPQAPENLEARGERRQWRGRALISWSRSLLQRRRVTQPGQSAPSTSLTEPLLPEGSSETPIEAMQVAISATLEEETPAMVTEEESSSS